jgi:hypothetical protein
MVSPAVRFSYEYDVVDLARCIGSSVSLEDDRQLRCLEFETGQEALASSVVIDASERCRGERY